jgi:CDP-glucose 4,6-dehydratase
VIFDSIATLQRIGGPVLITGHTGFKGIWMTLLLERLGLEVVGYSLPASESSLYNRIGRQGKVIEILDDIRNKNRLEDFFLITNPKFVIHMAAQPLVMQSYVNPFETFETNVMGTINVLEAAFKTDSVKVVGVVTTDKVYRNHGTGRRFVEQDHLEGNDPYSASKVATEAVIASWRNIQKVSGGPKIVSLRAGNVIGGGDFSENRIMPDIIRGLMNNNPVVIRNSNSTRPWQHVLDPLTGYLSAIIHANGNLCSDAFNFGPTEESYSVSKLLEIIEVYFPNMIEFQLSNAPKILKFESDLLDIDSSLSQRELGWHATWSQEEAIKSTIDWWQKVLFKNVDPLTLCLEDIEKRLSS